MKKVSLKSVKSYLNRDEMRMVSGGYGGTGGRCIPCSSSAQCGGGSCSPRANCGGRDGC